jgi:hypothetical protein
MCFAVFRALRDLCAGSVLGVFLCESPYLFPLSPCPCGCLLGSDYLYEGSHMLVGCIGVVMVLCGGSLDVFCSF